MRVSPKSLEEAKKVLSALDCDGSDSLKDAIKIAEAMDCREAETREEIIKDLKFMDWLCTCLPSNNEIGFHHLNCKLLRTQEAIRSTAKEEK